LFINKIKKKTEVTKSDFGMNHICNCTMLGEREQQI